MWFSLLPCAAKYVTATSKEGAACPTGYVQVSVEAECKGAATIALKASGQVKQAGSTGSWSDRVGGCFEGGGGSWNGNVGDGNVHFSTRDIDHSGGTSGYRICRYSGASVLTRS